MKRAIIAIALATLACSEALTARPPNALPEGIGVDVQAPERVPYTPSLLGTGPTSVVVVIANQGAEPLDVSKLALRVVAARPGLSLECPEEEGYADHDPAVLEPGKSHRFAREVDCRLPFAGRYTLSVAVALGPERAWRPAKTRELEVTAPPELAPRLMDDRGLIATIGATRFAGNATKRGHPRVGIALSNVGAGPIELPPVRVETRARHRDAPWSCTSTAAALSFPTRLESGSVHRRSVDVACLGFDAPGPYDVEIVLGIGDDRQIPLGSLRIDIGDDPAYVLPAPLR
jgi:hypothetical protein